VLGDGIFSQDARGGLLMAGIMHAGAVVGTVLYVPAVPRRAATVPAA
jgi:hypothetical protein